MQVLHRGAFVASSSADMRDLYRSAGWSSQPHCAWPGQLPGALEAVHAAVEEGEQAMTARNWEAVGTVNMRFHQALIGLAGSQRLDELMERPLAELRLVFHVMSEVKDFHESYLVVNREIVDLLTAGELTRAEERLMDYFDQAERQLLSVFAALNASDHQLPHTPVPAAERQGLVAGRR